VGLAESFHLIKRSVDHDRGLALFNHPQPANGIFVNHGLLWLAWFLSAR
jgi:hypothetical protein